MRNPRSKPFRTRLLAATAVGLALLWPLPRSEAATPQLSTKDKVAAREGLLLGGSLFTDNAGGHTAKAGDYAVNFGTGTGPVHVKDGAFLNTASANDEMTFAFWIKTSDLAGNSAFWAYSPSSSEGGRGFQAHAPWSNNNIYFDTAGCCDAATQRINAGLDTFAGYTGDVTWWTDNWRFLVFSKKGQVKQIWIDGQPFLEGISTSPLPTDFTELFIGAQAVGTSLVHGLMDDFSVFGTALTEAKILQLFSGTLPTALPASDKLMAYWDFNDYPAAGQFVSFTPTPDAAAAGPDLVQVVHVDGATAWDQNNVSLKVDDVAAAITLTRDGKKVTVKHVPSPLLSMQSRHKAALTYPGTAGPETAEWEFTVGPYTKDVVASRVGVFLGGSSYTGDTGGRTGAAGDRGVNFGQGTGPVYVQDGAFLNQATVNDEMTFAVWLRRSDIANGSIYWAHSPSSTSAQRGWQAHVPYSDNTVYFDTAGCCDAGTQRINASFNDFPDYTGDISYWTNEWRFVVLSKKAEVKQIWVDGKLFLEGYSTAPLPTDMADIMLGSENLTGGLYHGLMDDFSIFGTALTEAQIGQLFNGTLPTALPASSKLLAYWNFNDIPADGLFVSLTPTPGTTNAVPNLVQVVHMDGTTPWDLTKVSLKVDNASVAASAARDSGLVTVTYVPSPIFAQKSTHTATLTYPAGGGLAERTWQFTVGAYTKDVLHDYLGVIRAPAAFTADGGGHSGAAGDYAIDFGRNNAGQAVHIVDASFLNQASPNDEISVVAWQKLYQIADSALFWGVSPSSSGSQRGIGTHAPWSNNNLYFDTAGCCDASQRTTAAMSTDIFPDYSGTVDWWYSWHHFVFQKQGSVKEIWIDGKLFTIGDNSGVLPSDFTIAYLGFDPPDNATMRGLLDDFAVYKTSLAEADIQKLASGQAPNTLPASAGILAYWNFNDVPVAAPTIGIARDGANVKLTFTGTLESAENVTGPWSAVSGSSPQTVPTSGPAKYYRSK